MIVWVVRRVGGAGRSRIDGGGFDVGICNGSTMQRPPSTAMHRIDNVRMSVRSD